MSVQSDSETRPTSHSNPPPPPPLPLPPSSWPPLPPVEKPSFLDPQSSTPHSSGLSPHTDDSSLIPWYEFPWRRRRRRWRRRRMFHDIRSLSRWEMAVVLVVLIGAAMQIIFDMRWDGWGGWWVGNGGGRTIGGRPGRRRDWWEEFEVVEGYFGGRRDLVRVEEGVGERYGGSRNGSGRDDVDKGAEEARVRGKDVGLVDVTFDAFVPCYIDEENGVLPPKLYAYNGLPQGFPESLFGSLREVGLRDDVCYDRINRFGSYGFGFFKDDAGLEIGLKGDVEGRDAVQRIDYHDVRWKQAQEKCIASERYSGPRTAFVIRTWDECEYSPHHVMMLRSIISELALASGGRYTVHFLIQVQDDSIPFWESSEVYDQVLTASLPAEFAGMGTLWSEALMKLVYPPPFEEFLDDIYDEYTSPYFPLQHFATQHLEFEFFWEWNMDIGVTGGYLELLEQVTRWAERQDRDGLWEKSAKFYIPELFDGNYTAFEQDVKTEVIRNGDTPISGPQLPSSVRLSIPNVTTTHRDGNYVDLITFSPFFDPQRSYRRGFDDYTTGYPPDSTPPARASVVRASRLSRRLLSTMHHETVENKRTVFFDAFPASVALHYGYKAVYVPLPVYFDKNWPAHRADEVFNHGVCIGSGGVFGAGERVFEGSTWYSDARFAGYLWRRWMGKGSRCEIEWEVERGRMCLPMMVLHPVGFGLDKCYPT